MMRGAVVITLLALLLACGKEENCFSSAGAWKVVSMPLVSFCKIVLQDDVQLRLKAGKDYSAEIAFYENLNDGVLLDVRDSTLHVDNANKCRWLKKQERPQVIITMPLKQLAHFEHKGTENVLISDTLNHPNFFFETDGNAATVEFIYVGSNLRFVQHAGATQVTVRGSAQNASVYNGGHGETDFSAFKAGFMDVSNLTGAHIQVSATGLLQIRNYGRGTVIYCPEPQDKSINNFSSGRVEFCQNATP